MVTRDLLKLRILLSFRVGAQESCTVTGIARSLREEKQKVSRMMIEMEKEGVIDRSNTRAPVLTEKGERLSREFAERIRIAQNHLIYEGVDLESAKHDAYIWALYCSDGLLNLVRDNDACYRAKHELRGLKSFDGGELCKKLDDGCYQFPFIIYREQVKDGDNISMANEGFAHPCTLYVDRGMGVIQLLIQPMNQKSAFNGKILRGRVDKLEYFDSGRFIGAEFINDVVSFPADALTFVNMPTATGNILHGSICVKMRCSCGIAHMPESTAIFTMLI